MNSEGFPIMNSSDGVSEFLLKEGKGIVKRKKFADIGLNERVFVATKHNKEKIRQIMTVVEKYQDGEKNMIRFKRPNQVEFFREDQYVKVYSMNEIEKIHDQMDKGTYVAPVPPAPKPTPIKTVTVTTPPPDEEVSKEVVKPVDVVTSESAKLTAFVSENKDVIERISFPDLVATKKGNKNKVFIAGEGFNTEATVVSKTNSEVTFNVGGNLVTRTEKELNKSAEIYPMNSIERLENAQVEILSGVEFGQIALSVVMQQLKLKNENIVGDPVASEEGESFKVDFAFKQPGDTEPVPFSISFRVKGKEIIVDKQTPPIKFNTKTFVTKLTNQLRNGFNILKLEKVGTNLKFTKN